MHGSFKAHGGKKMSSEVRSRSSEFGKREERKARHFIQANSERKQQKYGRLNTEDDS
jgi:hypothetical protein